VLKLATVWNIEQIRQIAIDALEGYGKDDPILRLIVAKRYNIPLWFVPTINALAQRDVPPNAQDCERMHDLGNPVAICKFMLKVAEVRETIDQVPVIPSGCCSMNLMAHCYDHGYPIQRCAKAVVESAAYSQRGSHDFTNAIVRVFDCYPDGFAPHGSAQEDDDPDFMSEQIVDFRNMTLVPKPSSWDFS
jgi:hypothetical protein